MSVTGFSEKAGFPNADVSVFLQAHEDPMYDLIRENKRNEKETRYADSEFDFKGCGRVFFLLTLR